MNVQIYTQFKRPVKKFEKLSNKSVVEKEGYLSAKVRVENLINAGRQLSEFRKEQYDFPDGKVDENYVDNTRSGNYDMADAFQDSLAVGARLKEQADQSKETKKKEEKKDDEEGTSGSEGSPDTSESTDGD